MKKVLISVYDRVIQGTFVFPQTRKHGRPAVLLVHGWKGSEKGYIAVAELLAQLGAVCLTVNLSGHGRSSPGRLVEFSVGDHLDDLAAAYDFLASQRQVDKNRVGAFGASYGTYLLSFLSSEKRFQWLAFRAPALYPDLFARRPLAEILEDETEYARIKAFRRKKVLPTQNGALASVVRFEGQILVIAGEKDEMVPARTVWNYLGALACRDYRAKPVTYRVVPGADHRLSRETSRATVNRIITRWFRDRFDGS